MKSQLPQRAFDLAHANGGEPLAVGESRDEGWIVRLSFWRDKNLSTIIEGGFIFSEEASARSFFDTVFREGYSESPQFDGWDLGETAIFEADQPPDFGDGGENSGSPEQLAASVIRKRNDV